jgi:hypothetical protein
MTPEVPLGGSSWYSPCVLVFNPPKRAGSSQNAREVPENARERRWLRLNIGQICNEVNNYFINAGDIHSGDFEISEGELIPNDFLIVGQYFRIVGSVMNDGVYKHTGEPIPTLKDEEFTGQVWAMRVPKDFEDLATEIGAWNDKYGAVNSANMSPYTSESYAGQYSYSKSGGGSGGGSGVTWQTQFSSRLSKFRKVSAL